MKRAVCLISGGLDSFVSAAIAKRQGYEIYGMTVRYGQRNKKEIAAAIKVAESLDVEKHIITDVDLSWTRSALTDRSLKIPDKVRRGEIPATYVPARNTVLISIAISLAETVDADAIFTGVNAVDFSNYPDCKPEYLNRFQKLIDVATRKTSGGGKIKIHAPLILLSKTEIVKKGLSLGLDLSITWSCYRNGKEPCGRCPSCILRAKAFASAGLKDR
jgi:7-cyano-7-deazaguanine synthase